MCAYKYMSQAWRKPSGSFVKEVMRQEVIRWRRDPVIRRIDKPTRLDRARSLGYRAKQGYVVVRVRIRRGGARKSRAVSGRRPRATGVTKYTRAKSLKDIAQDRVARRFPNLRAINSYWVWADGRNTWFETVLVDPHHPVVRSTM